MCTVLLPPGVNTTALKKYIILYHIIISYHITYHIISHHIISYHITSYHISYHTTFKNNSVPVKINGTSLNPSPVNTKPSSPFAVRFARSADDLHRWWCPGSHHFREVTAIHSNKKSVYCQNQILSPALFSDSGHHSLVHERVMLALLSLCKLAVKNWQYLQIAAEYDINKLQWGEGVYLRR